MEFGCCQTITALQFSFLIFMTFQNNLTENKNCFSSCFRSSCMTFWFFPKRKNIKVKRIYWDTHFFWGGEGHSLFDWRQRLGAGCTFLELAPADHFPLYRLQVISNTSRDTIKLWIYLVHLLVRSEPSNYPKDPPLSSILYDLLRDVWYLCSKWHN